MNSTERPVNGPVRTLARRRICTNARWSVFLDRLAIDGEEVPEYLTIEPIRARNDAVTGVTVLPIVEGKVALLSCWRHALRRYMWEAPRGFLEANEEPHAAAIRELEEETGLICTHDSLQFAGHLAPEAATLAALGTLFIANECRPGPLRPVTEIGGGAMQLFARDQIASMLHRFEIQDATTAVLLLRWISTSA